jgi:hypothetical protein
MGFEDDILKGISDSLAEKYHYQYMVLPPVSDISKFTKKLFL